MRASDFLNEDAGVSNTGDYQQMLAFIRSNRVEGVPEDQQMALALFKELQKQRRTSQVLGSELDAAEKRIDIATQRGDRYEKELIKHQAALDQEHQDIEKQQATLGQIDQQQADRALANQKQIQSLTDKLRSIKTKPGIDSESAKALEKQIQDISKNGVPLDKFKELERSITAVQTSNSVDHSMITDLTAKLNDLQAKSSELANTKKSIGGDIEKATLDAQNQIDQLKQQVEKFNELNQKVDGIRDNIEYLMTGAQETEATVFDLENEIHRLETIIKAMSAARNASKMIGKNPAAASVAQTAPRVDPRLVQSLIDKGVLQDANEEKFVESIKWATQK
jgi:chromosome segregation ATPase